MTISIMLLIISLPLQLHTMHNQETQEMPPQSSIMPTKVPTVLDFSNRELTNHYIFKNTMVSYDGKLEPLSEYLQRYPYYLDLSHNCFYTVDHDLYSFVALQFLDLSNNGLIGLSPMINQLTALRSLLLANNKLQELPHLTKLTQLSELDLSNNKLIKLPPSLAQLRNLARLNLSQNPLPLHLIFEKHPELAPFLKKLARSQRLAFEPAGLRLLH